MNPELIKLLITLNAELGRLEGLLHVEPVATSTYHYMLSAYRDLQNVVSHLKGILIK